MHFEVKNLLQNMINLAYFNVLCLFLLTNDSELESPAGLKNGR